MKVLSVNTGAKKAVQWRKKTVYTGIYKAPVDQIELGKEDVEGDAVVDRKYHGGVDKACYLFSADAYPKFRELYPDLEWDWGMFGENITVKGLDESSIFIGDQYQIGDALVEVSEPRQPCFKLGIRFNNQKVLKDFIALQHSGVYVRLLEAGAVKAGDQMIRKVAGSNISIREVFNAIYQPADYQTLIKAAIQLPSLAQSTRKDLKVLD